MTHLILNHELDPFHANTIESLKQIIQAYNKAPSEGETLQDTSLTIQS